jgi:hypothetical protein
MRLSTFETVARALNASRVPFIIVGGIAVIAHGYGRVTQDLDIVIRLDPDVVHRTFETLASLGYRPRVPVTATGFADPHQRARWVEEKGMQVLNFHSHRHRETPIALFVQSPFDFHEELDLALVKEVAPGVPVRIVRLEI